MPRGGKREGAGRKPGARNKRSKLQVEAAEKGGDMPLDFLLTVMRDKKREDAERLDAAKAAAPYCHARLASTELRGRLDLSFEAKLKDLMGQDG